MKSGGLSRDRGDKMLSGEIVHKSGVDYLRWTYPEATQQHNMLPGDALHVRGDLLENTLQWYDTAQAWRFGRIDWHSQRKSQGTMLTMSGKDLVAYRDAGGDVATLVRHACKHGASFTRIDFAIDIHNSGRSVGTWATMVRLGDLRAKTRKLLEWNSYEGGAPAGRTIQLGSRTSERCLRIYDKAAEQKRDGDWVRLELEVHGRQARALAGAICEYGTQKAGKTMFKRFAESDDDLWLAITDTGSDDAVIESVKRRETNHERWVLEVAAPAVIAAILDGDKVIADMVLREAFGILPPAEPAT